MTSARAIGWMLAPLMGVLPAPASARTWGERLLVEAARRHPRVTAWLIEAKARDGRPLVVRLGADARFGAVVPLADAMGRPIGTLSITAARAEAASVAAALARHLYVAENLTEPDPFVAGAIACRRAQHLVDATLATDPDLVTLAMHVAPPGRGNVIVASSFGRIGKRADDDDADVVANGTVRREVTDMGTRLAVELPLLDRSGLTIGALSTSFVIRAGGVEAAYARALAVRDGLARRIASLAALTAR